MNKGIGRLQPLVLLLKGVKEVICKKYYLLLFGFLIFLANCGREKEVKDISFSSFVNVNTTVQDSLNLESYVKNIEFVLLETNSEAMIENIDKLEIEVDNIFVFDKKQRTIFIYSSSGKFLKKISKVGKASDEYFRIDDFYIDKSGEFIYILDTIRKRVLKYDFNAKLVTSYKLDFYAESFYKLEDGSYVFSVSGNDCNDAFCDKVIFCDANFKVIETFVPILSKFKGFSIETPTGRLISSSNDHFKYIDIDDMIYSFKGNHLNEIMRVDFMNDNLDLSFYDNKFGDAGEFLNAVINQKNPNWIHHYLENDLFIVFKYFKNRKTYSYIYSKESKKGMVLRKRDSDFISISPLFLKDNTFFEYRDPIALLQKAGQSTSSIDSLLYAKLKQEFPLINETSNPLIIKYSVEF